MDELVLIRHAVAVDELILELETEKVTLEVNSPAAGTVGSITKKEGATVAVGEIVGAINKGAGAPAKPAAALAAAPAVTTSATPANMLPPSAAKIVAENAIDPNNITGTGKDGRITKIDAIEYTTVKSAYPGTPRIALKMQSPYLLYYIKFVSKKTAYIFRLATLTSQYKGSLSNVISEIILKYFTLYDIPLAHVDFEVGTSIYAKLYADCYIKNYCEFDINTNAPYDIIRDLVKYVRSAFKSAKVYKLLFVIMMEQQLPELFIDIWSYIGYSNHLLVGLRHNFFSSIRLNQRNFYNYNLPKYKKTASKKLYNLRPFATSYSIN